MDIGRALTYFTDDERWVEKTAIGTGLLLVSTLLSVLAIGVLGYFILFGYLVRLVQNVRDDAHPVLPEWDQWGDDLVRGVKLACVYVVWALPIILIFVPAFFISFIVTKSSPYDSNYPGGSIGSIILSCAGCLTFLLGIAYAVFQPGFTIAFARNETISDGLQVSDIWEWTRQNIGNVVIVAILSVIASLIITTIGSIVGLILCIIGMVVTVPLSQLVIYYVQGHMYGQLARLAESGAASGPFDPMPPDAPPDDDAPVETVSMTEPTPSVDPVPPVVLDPTEEADPPAETDAPAEPEQPTGDEPPVEVELPVDDEPQAEDEPPAEPKKE